MNDRRRGALIGLAVGDALVAAVEFKSPGSFAPVTGYRNGGPHRLEAGEWTDDTSMALALADSIATAGWDLNDQADRYVQWWKTGKYSVNGRCFDIGITTRSALGNYVAKKNALASGDRSDKASSNGSIMRLAPVPIRYAHLYPTKGDELSRLAEECSLPTHASDQCVSACRYLGTFLAALIQGEDRDEVLSPDWQPLRQLNVIKPLHPMIQEIAQGSFRLKQPPAIQGSGWVVKSLEASLWAFHDAETFEEAVVENSGDIRVLFLEGEELVRAKQNRILNTSVLLPARSKIKIPVSCVERSRWAYKSRHFGSEGRHSPSKLRHALKTSVSESLNRGTGHRSDQGKVWEEVDKQQATLGVSSQTSAMADSFEAHQPKIDLYAEQFQYPEGAAGLAVAVGDKIVAVDLFDNPATCGKVWRRLLSGFILDAVGPTAGTGQVTQPAVEDIR